MRNLYVSLFVFLGILVQFLIHALVEGWYIKLLIYDFGKYGFGWSWDIWFLIHHSGSILLLVAGAAIGYYLGKYWWKRIYNK